MALSQRSFIESLSLYGSGSISGIMYRNGIIYLEA
jgi:hypothetical protein